jgi:hypothetical protein
VPDSKSLILGCHGHMEYGLIICNGTTNKILELTDPSQLPPGVLDYLGLHCKLFTQTQENPNTINNILNYLVQQKLMGKHLESTLNQYTKMHLICGLYMYITE